MVAMVAPVRLQQVSWDASVSVADIGTVETAEGIPMVYVVIMMRLIIRIPGISLRQWMGYPYIMEVILMIRIVRTPVILITKLGWTGVILTLRIVIGGFSRMSGRPSYL